MSIDEIRELIKNGKEVYVADGKIIIEERGNADEQKV